MTDADTPKGPLSGVKIVDMSTVVLGPFATQILGDLGADIIKIEHGAGDTMRHAGKTPSEGLGPIFMGLNRNKRALALDLKKDLAREALTRMLKEADVFYHNVRLGGIERLGFGYEDVKAINPNIIYVHCSGFGADGVYGGRQAYDDLVQAASGIADLLAIREKSAPQYMPTLLADKATGLYSVYSTLAALFHRERTGEGQFIEVPMLETMTHFNMVENLYGRTFVPSSYGVAYTRSINPRRKPYKTKDSFIAIVPYADSQWARFFEIGGREGVFEDERFATYKRRTENIGELYAIIEEVAQTRTTKEWLEILDEENIPAMRYNTMEEVLEDPHLTSVDFFEQRKHPQVGDYISIRHPVSFGETPASIRQEPRPFGADNEEILKELGFSADDIKTMME